MESIVFVHPPLSLEKRYGTLAQAGYTEPPFGLCYLAAVTRHHGFNTSIIDSQALNLDVKETVDLIISQKPDYIGITATTQIIKSASVIAKEVKRIAPRISIIIGGCHVTAVPEETLNDNLCFDIGVIGEGEKTFIELLYALEKGADLCRVEGLVIRKNGSVVLTEKRPFIKDLDTLPFPAFDLLPELGKYYRISTQSVDRLPALSLITSRGCTGKCTFCDTAVHGSSPREHSAEYVMDLMRELNKKYGAKTIFFDDDNFLIFKPRLRRLVELLRKEKLDLTWSCMARVDMVDVDTLKIAKEGGCFQIQYGIESGKQEILDFYNKRIRLEQTEHAVKLAKDVGLRTKGFIIFGNPLETKETLETTINFVKHLDLDDVSISFFTPYPGSKIYSDVERYGYFERDYEKMSCFEIVYVPHGLTKEELKYYSRKAYREFYFRPKVLLSYLRRIRSLSQMKELLGSGKALLKYCIMS